MSYGDYAVMDIDRIKEVTSDRILVEWEESKKDILKGKLVSPETHRKMHYTGIVVKKGPLVTDEINEGDRIMFDQFCAPAKFFDPDKDKRFAIIRECEQGTPFAIIPPREESSVEAVEGDFDWEA